MGVGGRRRGGGDEKIGIEQIELVTGEPRYQPSSSCFLRDVSAFAFTSCTSAFCIPSPPEPPETETETPGLRAAWG